MDGYMAAAAVALLLGVLTASLIDRYSRNGLPESQSHVSPESLPERQVRLEKPSAPDALLSSDDMIMSDEIPLLTEEEAHSQTQPIPISEDNPDMIVGLVKDGLAKLEGAVDQIVKTRELEIDAREKPEEEFNLQKLMKQLRSPILTPLDYDFPQQIAVIDEYKNIATPMAFVGQKSLQAEVDFGDPHLLKITAFDKWRPECRVCDGILFVRPYIRVLWPKESWTIDHLRSLRGTVEIDSECIAKEVPVDSWIVDHDGRGLTVLPFYFVQRRNNPLLWGGGYTDLGQCTIRKDRGPFLTKDSELTITLTRTSTPPLCVVVGCVMGVYSAAP